MSRRILDETTKSVFASDDYLYMDSATDGASKITPDNLVRNTTVAQQLAQHIADAEDDVEQITSDIETIQDDITDLRADLGDLSNLETEDKSSIVAAINEATQSGGSGSGLTEAIRTALLQIASKVAYIDADGQDYYVDLYDALYQITAIRLNTNSISLSSIGATSQLVATTTPEGGNVTWLSSDTSVATVDSTGLVTSVAYGSAIITATAGSVSATCSVVVAQASVTSISAVYTQSGTVYDNASLDSLKSDLVVTATWSNSTTSTVASADYTLSGTLTEGTSTITVSYGGKTITFNVTVTATGGNPTSTALSYEIGGISNTNGSDSVATNRVRTDYIPMVSGETLKIAQGDDNLSAVLRFYDSNHTYTGDSGANWLNNYRFTADGYCRAVLKKSDDSDFSSGEVDGELIKTDSAVMTLGSATIINNIRVFVGKGISDSSIIDNANRALSQPFAFDVDSPVSVEFIDYSATKVAFKNTVTNTNTIDTTAMVADDKSKIGQTTAGIEPWISVTNIKYIMAKTGGTYQYVDFSTNSTGYARFVFANTSNMSIAISETIEGIILLQGVPYTLVEADVADFE